MSYTAIRSIRSARYPLMGSSGLGCGCSSLADSGDGLGCGCSDKTPGLGLNFTDPAECPCPVLATSVIATAALGLWFAFT